MDSKEEATTLINSGQINGAVIIPDDFSESIEQGRQAEIIILKDDTNPQASMLITTFMFPMMFLSGVFFPVEQMPKFMQIISKFLPLTYAADVLRRVMTLGTTPGTVSFDIIILLAFGWLC